MMQFLKKKFPAKAPLKPEATTAHHLGPLRAYLTGKTCSKTTPVPRGCA